MERYYIAEGRCSMSMEGGLFGGVGAEGAGRSRYLKQSVCAAGDGPGGASTRGNSGCVAGLVSVAASARSAAREPAAGKTGSRVEALVTHAGVVVSAGRSRFRGGQLCQREGEDQGGLTRA